MPTKLPPSLRDTLIDALSSLDPGELDRIAKRDGSMLDYIQKTLHVPLSLAKNFISGKDRQIVGRMTSEDFDAVLDDLLARCPTQATVLWAHKAWYLGQMRRFQAVVTE